LALELLRLHLPIFSGSLEREEITNTLLHLSHFFNRLSSESSSPNIRYTLTSPELSLRLFFPDGHEKPVTVEQLLKSARFNFGGTITFERIEELRMACRLRVIHALSDSSVREAIRFLQPQLSTRPEDLAAVCFAYREHYVTSRYYRIQQAQPAVQYGQVSSLNRPSYDMHRIDADQFSSLFRSQAPSTWTFLALPLFRLLDADLDNLINMRDYAWLLLLIASSDYRRKLRLLFTVHSPDYILPEDRNGFWDRRSSASSLSNNSSPPIVECAEELTEETTVVGIMKEEGSKCDPSSAPEFRSRKDSFRFINVQYTGPEALEAPAALTKPSFIDLLKTINFILLNDRKSEHDLLHALARLGQQCQITVTRRNSTLAAESGAEPEWKIEFNDFQNAVYCIPELVLAFSQPITLASRINRNGDDLAPTT
uniref:EF-hand domain-containing protein n=1 Tax=Rodentolepis nana TaxID=102285 RepID=A0A0R3T5N5_RODNA